MKKINLDINNADDWANLDWSDPIVPSELKKTDASVNVGRANRIKAQDSEWIKQHRIGINNRNNNDEWKKNSAAVGYLGGTDEIKIRNSINNTGLGNPSSKGYTIGTNVKTGEEIIFVSAKDMKVAGFHHGHIYAAIKSGKCHKGYTWRREPI